MSVSDASVVSGVIAAYEAATINVELTLAVTAILLYDVILTLDKEIQYVWQSPRSWHQRALYILSRHALPVSNVLILGTLNPISNRVRNLLYRTDYYQGANMINRVVPLWTGLFESPHSSARSVLQYSP
ncbi:hypothetical protein C8Q77DRAFT_823402 [Trametes polyzona]|nr:hypothetical protein C8Q77DRAFT_823402 [Trametes polyzona]